MSSENADRSDDQRTNEKKEEGKNGAKRLSAAALVDAFAQQYRADRKDAGGREGHRIFREWLTIIGLFIAAAVAFFQWRELRSTDHNIAEQARIGAGQLSVMENQLKEMRATGEQTDALIAANKKLAEAAVQSAKATEESVRIAGDTAKRQLRAYLSISDLKIDCANCSKKGSGWAPPKKGEPEIRVLMTVKNSGSTPAYKVQTCSGQNLTERDRFPPDDFSYSCEKTCNTCPTVTIGPAAVETVMLPLDLGNFMMANAGFNRLFYYGTISFSDTYGGNRKVPFCWFYQGGASEGIGCPAHNTPQDD